MLNTARPATHAPPMTQRRIFLFWLPLAASWLLMGSEMPFVNAALARLNEAERMLAAFGIVAALSLAIESPVIMLLATSTALARSPQNYAMLRRFVTHLMLATTLVHFAVGWTPLFDVIVRGWMQVPVSIVEPVRLGMRLMVFWSAAIAWRRFQQGLLIRHGQTRFVGQGTLLRLLASAGLATLLAISGRVPGIVVGTLGLTFGVLVEAIYAHLAARPLVALKFGPGAAESAPRLSYAELLRFHTPLAASTLLYLLAQPLVAAALARLPNPEAILAAWPVAAGLLFISRSVALALPEVIIALIDEHGSGPALRQFSLRVGLICTAVLAVISFTPLGHFYFRSLIGVDEELARLAVVGGQIGLLLPLVIAWQSWFRGQLTAARATSALTLAMMANVLTMAVVLVTGVLLRAPGVALAATALTLSTGVETISLGLALRRVRARRR